jgi:hypothetical protein
MHVCIFVIKVIQTNKTQNLTFNLFLFRTSDVPRLCYVDTKVFLFYILHVIYILTLLKNLINPYQNPLGSFEDLSLHRDRQREATLFYTKLSDFVLY